MGRRFRGSIVSESFEINGGNNLAIERGFSVRRFPPIHCARSLKLRNVFALGYSTRWLYKNADSLPFTIRQKSDSVPFSKHGLENYLRNHRKQV